MSVYGNGFVDVFAFNCIYMYVRKVVYVHEAQCKGVMYAYIFVFVNSCMHMSIICVFYTYMCTLHIDMCACVYMCASFLVYMCSRCR